MTEEHKGNVWVHGIPTDADVKKLVDALGVPAPGTLVTHEQIEKATGLKRGTSRRRSVEMAWRKKMLREHNLVTEGVRGEGVMFCDSVRRIDVTARDITGGTRRVVRGIKVGVSTERDGLSEASCARLDNMVRTGIKGVEAMHTENKNRELLKLPRPRVELPPHRATANAQEKAEKK